MAVCAIALWRGGRQERLAAGGVLAGWALSMVLAKDRTGATQWGVLIIDAALFGEFLWLALGSRRYWPLFAAAFQLLAVVTHFGRALDSGVSGWAYFTAELIWSYLVIITIGYAAFTGRRDDDTHLQSS